MVLNTTWARRWVELSAQTVSEHRVELIELDRAIGDGDHGENLDRGFTAVLKKLGEAEVATVGDVLKLVATTLMSKVGGAAGPLYGTAFLRAAKVTAVEELGSEDVVALIEAALEGIVARGKAEVGDKTMVDSWGPAAEAARTAAAAGAEALDVLRAATNAAKAGAVATEPLVARKGRASYLGERAVGHRDPGAESTALLLQAAVDAADE